MKTKITLFIVSVLLNTSHIHANKPKWYWENRIHFHWEGWYPGPGAKTGFQGSYPDFQNYLSNCHSIVEESGANVTVAVTRHGAEGNWIPEQRSEKIEYYNANIIRNDVLVDYQSRGLKVICYHRHDMDYNVQKQHPEWMARDAQGNMIKKDRGVAYGFEQPYQICINSPYREIFKDYLVYTAKLGSNGFYFDEDHMPEVCFCDNCKQVFKKMYGKDMPSSPAKGSVDYQEIALMVGNSLADAFSSWTKAVQLVHPDILMLVSSSSYNQFTGYKDNERMATSGTMCKTESQKCFGGQQHWEGMPIRVMQKNNPTYYMPKRDLQESLEWIIARDVMQGAPPHIWIWNPSPKNFGEFFHSFVPVVAHGCVAGLNAGPVRTDIEILTKAFSLNNQLLPYMEDALPYNWAVVYISNQEKERLQRSGITNDQERYKIMFERFYAPILGAAQTLQDAKYPFGVITDNLLSEGAINTETKVIIVPEYTELQSSVKSYLDKLEKQGVTIIYQKEVGKPEQKWYLEEDQKELRKSLLAKIINQGGLPPIYGKGPDNVKMTYLYNKLQKNFIVGAVRDWHWFWYFGKHESTWAINDKISGVEIITSETVRPTKATIVDYKGSTQLNNKPRFKKGVITLSGFDFYNFITIQHK